MPLEVGTYPNIGSLYIPIFLHPELIMKEYSSENTICKGLRQPKAHFI